MVKNPKTLRRESRKRRIRARVFGTAERPRISVFRSNTRMVAQVIDDVAGKTLAYVSTSAVSGKDMKEKVLNAGAELAQKMKDKNIDSAVFDRGGYAYVGNVKTFADAVRDGGIKF